MTRLDQATAESFAQLTLSHIGREYPHKLDHVLNRPEDAATPSTLHPIFHGSFDWHSCVHGWWQLLRLMRLFPGIAQANEIRAGADAMLAHDRVAGELAYLDRPGSAGFERPYGWAWVLALHGEAAQHEAGWAAALEPLARAFSARFRAHLPKLTYPIRTGTHFNTAFALTLAGEWAAAYDRALAELIEQRARAWFEADRHCQAWEPGGDEFLSPALMEALLMSRVLGRDAFTWWFDAFLPELAEGRPATLFEPALVSDRSDGKIAHLDGLNLSRAWCWRGIGRALGEEHRFVAVTEASAQRHLAASLPHIADDYMGTHWLSTFALLALDEEAR
ncbi:MAG: 4-carboxymuconolactone decarboxylase [uncultured Sphingomonadaceae bacterium]|uniref:4-carboxymuconolactone decarboxylase n=1 Tax=uncultured Sphingomonadaceae bacterium TaxID=169976 RepID=A0A6J4SDA3_9SPHN|nr:MAG: 4-carboxymuconolactone decarboxylase [uncultured Sphingomonadaceae bacterium]